MVPFCIVLSMSSVGYSYCKYSQIFAQHWIAEAAALTIFTTAPYCTRVEFIRYFVLRMGVCVCKFCSASSSSYSIVEIVAPLFIIGHMLFKCSHCLIKHMFLQYMQCCLTVVDCVKIHGRFFWFILWCCYFCFWIPFSSVLVKCCPHLHIVDLFCSIVHTCAVNLQHIGLSNSLITLSSLSLSFYD